MARLVTGYRPADLVRTTRLGRETPIRIAELSAFSRSVFRQ
jgi:hypothetical protein